MEALTELVRALGGGLALLFIVTLAIGIALTMVVYLGSAVVVLERFARAGRRRVPVLAASALVAVIAGLALASQQRPELAIEPWGVWLQALAPFVGGALLATALCLGIVLLALRRFDSARLGTTTVALLAACLGLLAGSTGQPSAALAPPAAFAAAALLANALARSLGSAATADIARGLWRISAGLAVGLPFALLPLPAQALSFAAWLGGHGVGLVVSAVALGLVPLAIGGFVDVRGSTEWFIAVRYLVAKRRQVFISAITAICVVGIAAGVWLIIVVLSVMNGFEQIWREEILGNRAHFVVQSGAGPIADYDAVVERVRSVEGVVAASPYLDSDAMVRGQDGEIFSVRVRGVDPARVGDVTSLRDDMLSGSLDALEPAPAAGEDTATREEGVEPGDEGPLDPGMVIGNQLASALGVGVGDDLLVISPFGGPPTPLGPAPRLQRFRVVGVFRSSFYQYDEVYAYVSIASAQAFRRSGPVIDGIEGLTTDHYRSRRVGEAVEAELGRPFHTRDWKDYFPAFFQALKTERVMMFLLLTMIMVVAAFVIVATLIMMIMEKSSDIAILKAMGAEDSMIERIFALEGTLIGLVGTLLGVAAGIAVTHRLRWIQAQIEAATGIDTLPASVYQFSALPSRVDPLQVGAVVLIAMVLSLGATLLPSRQGARIDPAEGLRHE